MIQTTSLANAVHSELSYLGGKAEWAGLVLVPEWVVVVPQRVLAFSSGRKPRMLLFVYDG